jgi:hypothetical protein
MMVRVAYLLRQLEQEEVSPRHLQLEVVPVEHLRVDVPRARQQGHVHHKLQPARLGSLLQLVSWLDLATTSLSWKEKISLLYIRS